jgi:hypothetical protein
MPNPDEWVRFTKRTDDPKLAHIEGMLDELGIEHRRNGESWHAPILEVRERDFERAYDILRMPDPDYGTFDDVPDDDSRFLE